MDVPHENFFAVLGKLTINLIRYGKLPIIRPVVQLKSAIFGTFSLF